jgi:hypothetical protein
MMRRYAITERERETGRDFQGLIRKSKVTQGHLETQGLKELAISKARE